MTDRTITVFSVKPREIGDVIMLVKKATAETVIPGRVVGKHEDDPKYGHNARDYYKVLIQEETWLKHR